MCGCCHSSNKRVNSLQAREQSLHVRKLTDIVVSNCCNAAVSTHNTVYIIELSLYLVGVLRYTVRHLAHADGCDFTYLRLSSSACSPVATDIELQKARNLNDVFCF